MCEDSAVEMRLAASIRLELTTLQGTASYMPRKRKKRTFSAAKAVREMARQRVGSPKPSRLVTPKKSKPEKHKPTLGKLLADE